MRGCELRGGRSCFLSVELLNGFPSPASILWSTTNPPLSCPAEIPCPSQQTLFSLLYHFCKNLISSLNPQLKSAAWGKKKNHTDIWMYIPTSSWFPLSSVLLCWRGMPLNDPGRGFPFSMPVSSGASIFCNTEFQKDSPQGLQDPSPNSGDMKMAEKALQSLFRDFNHDRITPLGGEHCSSREE